MVLITIVTGDHKPTYNWGASHCIDSHKARGWEMLGMWHRQKIHELISGVGSLRTLTDVWWWIGTIIIHFVAYQYSHKIIAEKGTTVIEFDGLVEQNPAKTSEIWVQLSAPWICHPNYCPNWKCKGESQTNKKIWWAHEVFGMMHGMQPLLTAAESWPQQLEVIAQPSRLRGPERWRPTSALGRMKNHRNHRKMMMKP